ncbi:SAN1 [Candida theae]|uniref:SAN1 n=1 Tax=Candida theae TaxID=1198502 RepID=A0AAD5BGA0_9ASCO|nr:SAN1 [Candida theae]KAI5960868.1 SAN1 [Candida theae]
MSTPLDNTTNHHRNSSSSNNNNTNQPESSSISHSQFRSREHQQRQQPNFFKRLSKALNLFQSQTPTFATGTADQQNTLEPSSTGRLRGSFRTLLGKGRSYTSGRKKKKMESDNTGDQDNFIVNEIQGTDRDVTESPRIGRNTQTDFQREEANNESDFESRIAEFFPNSSYRDLQHNTNQSMVEETTESNAQPEQNHHTVDNSEREPTEADNNNNASTTNSNNNNTANTDTNNATNETTSDTNNTTSDNQPNILDDLLDTINSASNSNNNNNSNGTDTDTHNRAIVITVNYLFSDQNTPDNPNRSGSLVLSLPNNSNNRDPGSIQEFIRIATQMAYSMVMNGLHNQPRGITLNKFESFEKVNVRHLNEEESKVCSICFEEFEDVMEEEQVEDEVYDQASVDDEESKKDASNSTGAREGVVVRKKRRLVDKTSRLLRRFSRSHTERMEDGERRTPNGSETSSVSDYVTPIASSNMSSRPTFGSRAPSNGTTPITNENQSMHSPHSSTTTASQPQPQPSSPPTQDTSQPVYLIDVKDPFDHSPIKMPCNHIFGQDCLSEWLKQHSTCPLCRHSVAEPVNSQGQQHARDSPGTGVFQGLPQAQHQQINGQNYTFYTIPHESLPDLGNAGNDVGGGNNSDDPTQASFADRLAQLLRPALMGQAMRRSSEVSRGRENEDGVTTPNNSNNHSIEPLLRVMQQAREARERMVRSETGANPSPFRRVNSANGADFVGRGGASAQPPTYIQALRNQGERPFARLRDTSPGLEGRMRRIGAIRPDGEGEENEDRSGERATRSRSINSGFRERMRRSGANDYEEQERSRSFLPGYSEIMNYIRNGFSGLRNTSSRLNGDADADDDVDIETRRRHREMTLHPGGLISMRTANGIETFTDEEVERMLNRQDNSTDGGDGTLRSPRQNTNSPTRGADGNAITNADDHEDGVDPSRRVDDYEDEDEVVDINERRRRGSLDSLSYHHRNYG